MAKHSEVKKVGILTAGGDSPGLNAAIRGFGKAAINRYGVELIGFQDGISGLVENRTISLGTDDLAGILTLGGTILGTSRDKVYRWHVGDEVRDMVPTAVQNYKRNKLDALIMLGGGGTLKNARRLVQAGLNVLALPKTIDNDIAGTDTSFGYATATEIATEAIDRLHSTAHSHHRIILAEVMGHKVGWLTLAAGIAGGADVILIPEIPYTVDSVAATIRRRIKHGTSFSVIAVAEGARDVHDAQDYEAAKLLVKSAKDAEAKRAAKNHLANVEDAQREHTFKLARQLEAATGLESRVTILGYVQRGGTPCAVDRVLATRLGVAAADLAAKGKFGYLVAARGDGTDPIPIVDWAGKLKYVPRDHKWIEAAREVGTGFGD